VTYDNTLKYLVEQFPEQFVRWLLGSEPDDLQILKTELSLEPIRADAVTFLKTANQILHLEVQTLPASTPPLPLRMLDYWVRLHRQYSCDIEQVIIFLKPTSSELAFIEQFTARNTSHRYRVIRIWEQPPEPLLAAPGLLPLAALAQTDSPQQLLQQVAAQVNMIEEPAQQRSVSACVQLVAGLILDKEIIQQLFRRDIMRESVIYQEILQEGRQEGREEGRQEGRQEGREEGRQAQLKLILRLLQHQLHGLSPTLQAQVEALPLSQLTGLGEASLDFRNETDLVAWLDKLEESGTR
jgi:predicted transposase/invertase (TIGR01784 family)